jgi:hypothetical protein
MARIALALLAVVLLISPCVFLQEFRSTVRFVNAAIGGWIVNALAVF